MAFLLLRFITVRCNMLNRPKWPWGIIRDVAISVFELLPVDNKYSVKSWIYSADLALFEEKWLFSFCLDNNYQIIFITPKSSKCKDPPEIPLRWFSQKLIWTTSISMMKLWWSCWYMISRVKATYATENARTNKLNLEILWRGFGKFKLQLSNILFVCFCLIGLRRFR